MATPPSSVRAGLAAVTAQAQADVQTITAAAGDDPAQIRAALFATAPLVVGDYGDGAAELALGWYEELREEARPRRPFTPQPFMTVQDDRLASAVAWATEGLHDLERQFLDTVEADVDRLVQEATDDAMNRLLPEIQKEVAAGFRDTITGNAIEDPEASGWRRFAQPDACKFCLMLAARGAVFTEDTARFAAHTNDHCLAGPSFDPEAPRADLLQYTASQRTRTPEQRARLREYLNEHFPDAHG